MLIFRTKSINVKPLFIFVALIYREITAMQNNINLYKKFNIYPNSIKLKIIPKKYKILQKPGNIQTKK